MGSFTIKQVIEASKGQLLNGDLRQWDTIVKGVSTDTRTIEKGNLFIPLEGENFDGHNFIDKAIEKGAGALLTHRDDGDCLYDIPTIKVADTLRALQDLAAFHRRRFSIPVVAVTGSNGKTTSKDMIALVLSKGYKVLKTQGNLNNEIGLPLTLLGLEESHQVAVVEMGMNHLGEIQRLAQIAKPNIAVITNIGVSHLENLGSRENILKAKLEILDFFTSKDKAILNGDDEFLGKTNKKFPFEVEYYGTEDRADIRATNIEILGEQGISYDLKIGHETCHMEIPVPGKHNVYNSLAAAAVGNILGIEFGDMAAALKTFRPGSMRLNIFTTDSGIRVIDDVYNASPDSMKASIEILKDIGGERKIAILGDMLELGNYSHKGHTEVGQVVADKKIDLLLTVGRDSRFIGMGARNSGMSDKNIIHLDCNKDLMKYLGTILNLGDTILVKGSRSMKLEEVVEYLRVWAKRQS
ncbi:MAG: UDP-N-acetylmuramoyl-tripeptide--D-alanyl-D-alanine ligase [Clostridiales bacterium]|nr:UDP-N-acetylmuramoyl-tripeptide--D-alanyl-D-alanine ligase [Clostridiales bacterium]